MKVTELLLAALTKGYEVEFLNKIINSNMHEF